MQGIIENTSTELVPWQCHLEDVAKAHVRAAEVPEAKGRYLITTPHEVSDKAVADLLSKRFPQYKFRTDAKDQQAKPFADVTKVCGHNNIMHRVLSSTVCRRHDSMGHLCYRGKIKTAVHIDQCSLFLPVYVCSAAPTCGDDVRYQLFRDHPALCTLQGT